MKKLLLVSALALTCASVAVPRANAQVTAQFVFTPTSNTTNVAPGSTITFSINLNVSGLTGGDPTAAGLQDLYGVSFYLQQNGPGPYIFAITGRNTSGSPFYDLPQWTDAEVTTSPFNRLDPINDRDLGGLAASPMGDGNYFVANISLSVGSGSSGGVFTIQSTPSNSTQPSVITDSHGDTMPVQAGSFTVSVIPEPSTYALLLVGALGAGVAYRRRVRG